MAFATASSKTLDLEPPAPKARPSTFFAGHIFAPATSHITMLVFSARARTLWGHAPRVRSAAAFRRGLATVADHIDAR